MYYKKSKHKKGKSERKKIRDRIGKLHLELLKRKRNNYDKDEISNKKGVVVGRFHILSVGSHPKLEFVDENVLLVAWFPTHFAWHHFGANHPKTMHIEERIRELRGEDYREKLFEIERCMSQHSKVYLMALEQSFRRELAKKEKVVFVKSGLGT